MADGTPQGNNSKTIISSDVEIMGTLKSASAIEINGKLNGDLNCSGDAAIGEQAVIKGNLSVNCVTIGGTINGNVTAKDRIEMKATARVQGDIKAKRLAVVDGVSFIGKSEVNPAGISSAPSAPSAPVGDGGDKGDDDKRGIGLGKK